MDDQLANPFNAHLDICQRCANQPFNLCPEGTRLADIAFRQITEKLGAHLGLRPSTKERSDV